MGKLKPRFIRPTAQGHRADSELGWGYLLCSVRGPLLSKSDPRADPKVALRAVSDSASGNANLSYTASPHSL